MIYKIVVSLWCFAIMDQSIANMCIKNIDNTWWTINGCCIWKWVCIVSLCVDGNLRMCLDVCGVVDKSNGKSDISKWKKIENLCFLL